MQIMINTIEKDGKKFVSAKELYTGLDLNVSHYSRWAKKHIIESKSKYKDYSPSMASEKGKGNFSNDYLLSVNFAKFLCTTSGSELAIEFVEYLIGLDNKTQDGLLLDHSDITTIVTLTNACYEESFRKLARKKHISTYLPNNPAGYDFAKAENKRKLVCGIDKNEIENRLNQMNKKFKGIEKALINVDKHELIRISVIDAMIFFGKTKEYAMNIGNLAKELSIKQSSSFTSKNMMFPLPQELEAIYLQLNK